MLEFHKVYRNTDLKDLIFGFELIDFLLIFLVFNIANIFQAGLIINLTATVCVAILIRLVKLNKPRGYLLDAARFLGRRRRWSNSETQ